MKKIFLLLAFASSYSVVFSQVLFTYGNNKVSKEEFLKAYNKNKTSAENVEASLREYLDLYINFKLKVAAAKNLRIDTLPQLQYDVQAFKNQVLENYLNDENDVNALVNEAFARSQKDIHVQHFFIPGDTGMLYLKAGEALYADLKKRNDNYENLIKKHNYSNQEQFKIKTADLGYVTAFSLPYEFENIIYGLVPGTISRPYASKKGVHIFKMLDDRKAIGRWRIAQILVAVPPGEKAENLKSLQLKTDSIYQLLKNGADFGQLAKQLSDDKLTYLNNGEMPEFGSGKYDLSFENEVIKLKNDGDISLPFVTSHGFHIVKRITQTPVPDNSDNVFIAELKQKVLQDPRINKVKDKFIANAITKIGFKRNNEIKDAGLFAIADSVFYSKSVEKFKRMPIYNKNIFSFTKRNVRSSSWLNFINEYKNNPQLYKGESNAELMQKFINIQATNYYKEHLEQYNPQFAYQMKEFREGNMLFEMMEKNVWGKAANDTAGLQKFYADNKIKYTWGPSADVIIFNCPTVKAANKAFDAINKNSNDWKKILEENAVQTDSGRYELSQIPIENAEKINAGLVSNVIISDAGNSASFVKVIKVYPTGQQRSFEEARGFLINDFQNKIEAQWIANLKKKYPVKINEAVFKSLLKE